MSEFVPLLTSSVPSCIQVKQWGRFCTKQFCSSLGHFLYFHVSSSSFFSVPLESPCLLLKIVLSSFVASLTTKTESLPTAPFQFLVSILNKENRKIYTMPEDCYISETLLFFFFFLAPVFVVNSANVFNLNTLWFSRSMNKLRPWRMPYISSCVQSLVTKCHGKYNCSLQIPWFATWEHKTDIKYQI